MIRRNERGLTLVEVVIVCAIIAILAVASGTLLGNVLSVLRTRGAAEQLATAIRLARQSAITAGEHRCITITQSPPSFTITGGGNNATCGGAAVADLQGSGTLGGGSPLLWPVTPPADIRFDPVGRTYPLGNGNNAGTTFSMDSNPASCVTSVTVTLYGGVKVQRCA
jgi:prepilin-type N-terminal cleavage/methylation domain-containing protein